METATLVDLERVLIGFCLLSERAAFDVARRLEGWEFTDPACSQIFAAIKAAVTNNAPIDQITIAEYLDRDGRLDQIGGKKTIESCISTAISMGTPSHLDSYVLSLVQRAKVRRLAWVADTLRALSSSGDDPQEVLNRASRILDDAMKENTQVTSLPISDATAAAYRWIAARYAGLQPGISTGFSELDNLIGGMRPGQLIVLAGRTKMGKSAVVGHMALSAARRGHKVLIATLEMPAWQWLVRWVAATTGISYRRLMKDQITEQEESIARAALDRLRDLPVRFIDNRALRILDLRIEAQAMRVQKGLDLVVVDHIGLLGDVVYGRDPVKDLGDAAKRLREMAQKLEVPVVVLAQLSRAVELQGNKRPQLHHLRESGHLEQDSDLTILIYRDSYYYMPGTPIDADTGEPARKGSRNVYYVDPHLMELIVAANRDGPPGVAYVFFDPETMTLGDFHKPHS